MKFHQGYMLFPEQQILRNVYSLQKLHSFLRQQGVARASAQHRHAQSTRLFLLKTQKFQLNKTSNTWQITFENKLIIQQ